MFSIIREKIVFNSTMVIEEGTIEQSVPGRDKRQFPRLRLNRQDASTILIHNTERHSVVLVKQFRYAISAKVKEPVLELVAGKIDEGEEPLQAAIREAEEECGYRIRPENIKLTASFFVSPGYTSERFFLYHATVTNADKVSAGGGLEQENEYLEVIEIGYDHFIAMAMEGGIQDGKTLMAALYLQQRKP